MGASMKAGERFISTFHAIRHEDILAPSPRFLPKTRLYFDESSAAAAAAASSQGWRLVAHRQGEELWFFSRCGAGSP